MIYIAVVTTYVLILLGIGVYKSRAVLGMFIGIVLVETLMMLIALVGFAFPVETDYIAIPAVIVSVSTLIIVSLATPRPDKADSQNFMEPSAEPTPG